MTAYQPGRPGPTILRIAAIRWLVAMLIPFACIIGGLVLGREWKPTGVVIGFLFGLIGSSVFTTYYLYKVLGAAPGWGVTLIPLGVSATYLGSLILINGTSSHDHLSDRSHPVITGTYWIAWAILLGLIALTVVLGIINGERWMQKNRRNLPRNKFEAYARSRGTLAHLWLPR